MKFTITTTLTGKMSREQKDPNIDLTEEVIDKSKLIKLEYAIPPNFDKKNPLLIISPIENLNKLIDKLTLKFKKRLYEF
jgi:hypothetical protein